MFSQSDCLNAQISMALKTKVYCRFLVAKRYILYIITIYITGQLEKIYQDLFAKMVQLEEEKYDINHVVSSKDSEVSSWRSIFLTLIVVQSCRLVILSWNIITIINFKLHRIAHILHIRKATYISQKAFRCQNKQTNMQLQYSNEFLKMLEIAVRIMP